MPTKLPHTEKDLIALALALIGSRTRLSEAERQCAEGVNAFQNTDLVRKVREAIASGDDPLGEAFIKIRAPNVRRADGATYTPERIISSMISWAAEQSLPARVIDPGAGSGRFLMAAAKQFPKAQLIGIELDPLAALLLRANVKARGLTDRTTIVVDDYRAANLPDFNDESLFIGNPPYVRHHNIRKEWKVWFADSAASFGIKASKLAGLHIHFFLRTMQLAKPGDHGVFITSSEWLDVNYGTVLRQLLANGLGGVALHVLDPKAMPFPDATTTGAITCFRVGKRPNTLKVRTVETLDKLNGLSTGTPIHWSKLEKSNRWSTIIRPGPAVPSGYIELGEICRVHRGQVTGCNDIWIAGDHTKSLPENVLIPAVTKARDIIEAGGVLEDASRLRKVVNLPTNLEDLDLAVLPAVHRFLRWARSKRADKSYTALHRRAWWAVGLKDPAPIVCTYMARRPPTFVRNLCNARHINIAHGLYPHEQLDEKTLDALAAWLHRNVGIEHGRTYAGGLIKFEPKELERVPVPRLENLLA